MMRLLSKFLSYLLHPLFTPTYGTIFYFLVTPKYSPLEMQAGNSEPLFRRTLLLLSEPFSGHNKLSASRDYR